MAVQESISGSSVDNAKPKGALFNDPAVRGWVFQGILIALIVYAFYSMGSNAATNLKEAGTATGFGFLSDEAGFGISFSPFIDYSEEDSYGKVYWVGLQNTLLIAALGIFFATIIGFFIGIARLSSNWVVSRMAYVYVEIVRNIPLLLQIFIWYKGVLTLLPQKKDTLDLGVFGLLNVQSYTAPKPVFAADGSADMVGWALLAAIVIMFVIKNWAHKRQMSTGQQFPTFLVGLGLIVLLPAIVYFIQGQPISLEYPVQGKFRASGGMGIPPEFTALLLALSIYTAAFIAEIVRAGIMAVDRGQTEASYALGLQPGPTLRLVVIPQAMRVIIPPLTSQYLNLTKNSSLAVAIAYPDLYSIFTGTVLNQTGQAVELVMMTMVTYLTISILTSMFMNWYNSRMSLVER